MAEWWKTITEKLGKASTTADEPSSLRDRLEREKAQLKQSTQRGSSSGGGVDTAMLAPGESVDEARAQDLRALSALLAWKLDTRIEPADLSGNPAKVDGYWFGAKRYWRKAHGAPGDTDGISWKLHFFRPCNHCKFLVPTIDLGDYTEVTAAVNAMLTGQDANIPKSTRRLASYLADLEAGKPDAFCPRVCPACHKLIRGGTL